MCFPVNIAKFLRAVFIEHLWWLLLFTITFTPSKANIHAYMHTHIHTYTDTYINTYTGRKLEIFFGGEGGPSETNWEAPKFTSLHGFYFVKSNIEFSQPQLFSVDICFIENSATTGNSCCSA